MNPNDSPWLDQDKAEAFMRTHILRHWDRERIVRFAKHLLVDECQECPKHAPVPGGQTPQGGSPC